MGTNVETMWVSDQAQLQATVQTLVSQGGVVQGQSETDVQVYLKKKLNIVVVIVGLILCLVPGIAYLIWYSTADQNQQISVRIGQPGSINTTHEHWYDEDAIDGASPGTVPPVDAAPPAAPLAPGATAPPAPYNPPASGYPPPETPEVIPPAPPYPPQGPGQAPPPPPPVV
jgi:hypothetical protein